MDGVRRAVTITIPRIAITPGEPAGIGPELVVKLAQQQYPAQLVAIADPDLLTTTAAQLKLPLTLSELDLSKSACGQQPGELTIIPVSLAKAVIPGQLNQANADHVLTCLQTATHHCIQHELSALVTGPVQKSIINAAGLAFSGHTEYLAKLANVDHVVMLFVAKQLRVALLTTHVALAEVPKLITAKKLQATLTLIQKYLTQYFAIKDPRIVVCGLNPHAGENGYLGREEIDIMIPALAQLRDQGMKVSDPLPADTVFTPQSLQQTDVVLAMYHDQGLPVIKHYGFSEAVNMTLGLPFIRTSVDHGTALDIAGKGIADVSSLQHATQMAIQLVANVHG